MAQLLVLTPQLDQVALHCLNIWARFLNMANMVDVVAIRRKYEKQPENVVLEVLDRLLVHLMGIVDSEPMNSRLENTPIRRPVDDIPRDKQQDVQNFSIVNKSFNNAYRTRIYRYRWKPSGLSFERKSPFEWLPTEVLDKILHYLVPKPNILTIDDRSYLSLESFASVEPGALSESDHLPNFVCDHPHSSVNTN